MELREKIYSIPDKDLIDKKFGRWTVIRKGGHNYRGDSYWVCKCDCGTEKIVKQYSLLSGQSKSCGCITKELNLKKSKPYGVTSSNRVYDWYKKHATESNRIFELTKDEFLNLTSSNCCYCGGKPNHICKKGKIGEYIYNGIDRIDNAKGYIYDNCVPCCETCNRAKLKMGKNEFLAWIDRVYLYQHKEGNK